EGAEDAPFDLAKFVVGSEGTLVIATRALVDLAPGTAAVLCPSVVRPSSVRPVGEGRTTGRTSAERMNLRHRQARRAHAARTGTVRQAGPLCGDTGVIVPGAAHSRRK
ncbi:hypothetical protein AB0O82_38685, partial [Kitasatospora sp. NPDC088264]|uniref:hypothetical protein n=1 Tax=Kitasatospora sp. NPDC088264 TaxID=3155296 RepID=UPI00341F11F3